MATARIVQSGEDQTLVSPKEFHFTSNEVEILRRGNEIVLREKQNPMVRAFEILANLPDHMAIRPEIADQGQTQPKRASVNKSRTDSRNNTASRKRPRGRNRAKV